MGGQACPNSNSIRDLVVVVTGAAGGLGKELCKELAGRRSAHVIMACRNLDKADQARQSIVRELPGAELELLPLDLRSFDSVRRFVREVQSRHAKVDVLINNAGIIFHPQERTVDGFEAHLQCNYLGKVQFLTVCYTLNDFNPLLISINFNKRQSQCCQGNYGAFLQQWRPLFMAAAEQH